jgi:hypothetical protein
MTGDWRKNKSRQIRLLTYLLKINVLNVLATGALPQIPKCRVMTQIAPDSFFRRRAGRSAAARGGKRQRTRDAYGRRKRNLKAIGA